MRYDIRKTLSGAKLYGCPPIEAEDLEEARSIALGVLGYTVSPVEPGTEHDTRRETAADRATP